jgi:Recombination endonuclease VII
MGRKGRPRRIVQEFTTCTKCKNTLPTTSENFRMRADRKYPVSWCRPCERTNTGNYFKSPVGKKVKAAYTQRNQEKLQSQELMRRVGITLEEKNRKFEEQGRKCAACGTSTPCKGKNPWHADHCHKTGKFRGVLCRKCNTTIGFADDDVGILLKLICYLLQNGGKCGIIKSEQ